MIYVRNVSLQLSDSMNYQTDIYTLNLHKVTEGIMRSIVYGFIKQQKMGIISF